LLTLACPDPSYTPKSRVVMVTNLIASTWLLLAPAQQVAAVNVAQAYVEADAAAVIAPPVLPSNVRLFGRYQMVVNEMLQRSAAFRRQCSRLGREAWLEVTVKPELLPGGPARGATTTITRTARGGIEAVVRLTEYGDLAELIAHEFEHILEQLDEVDLAAMAARSRTGVRAASDLGHFETDRAIAAGRRVYREVAHVRR